MGPTSRGISIWLAVVAFAVLAIAVVAAPAEARKCEAGAICHKVYVSDFQVTISGRQTMTWSEDRDDFGSCHGRGTEVVTFSTPKAQKTRMSQSGPQVSHWVLGQRDGVFPITAKIDHETTYAQTDGCEPDVTDTPAGNCSRSTTLPWQFQAPSTHSGDNIIVLDDWLEGLPDSYHDPYFNPFPGCRVAFTGTRFPDLLRDEDARHIIHAPLSTRKLLHSTQRSFTTTAHGTEVDEPDSTGIAAKTEINWTMTLKRVGKKPRVKYSS